MSLLAVTASKPEANSKLGFTYSTVNGWTTITSVNAEGLFAGTGLKEGQRILTINGSSARDLGGPAMNALLSSLGAGEVAIVVEDPPGDDQRATFECTTTRDKMTTKVTVQGKMKTDDCPQILVDAGVPWEEWLCVRSLIAVKLMPAALQCAEQNGAYTASTFDHVDSTVRQSHGVRVCVLHNNATLVAAAVKDQINAIVSKYGVTAALEYETYESVNKTQMAIATGFTFLRV